MYYTSLERLKAVSKLQGNKQRHLQQLHNQAGTKGILFTKGALTISTQGLESLRRSYGATSVRAFCHTHMYEHRPTCLTLRLSMSLCGTQLGLTQERKPLCAAHYYMKMMYYGDPPPQTGETGLHLETLHRGGGKS